MSGQKTNGCGYLLGVIGFCSGIYPSVQVGYQIVYGFPKSSRGGAIVLAIIAASAIISAFTTVSTELGNCVGMSSDCCLDSNESEYNTNTITITYG